MSIYTILIIIATLAILSAIGLIAWAWIVIAHTARSLRSLKGFEGIHFEDRRNEIRNLP
jgi:hypothetical protein